LAGLLLPLLLAAPAAAAITQTINYQGFLLSKITNMPVEGGQAVKFVIYNAPSGGSPLFSEERCGVPVLKGRYDVEIGSATAGGIPDSVFLQNQNLWLEIQVSPTGACGGSYEAMTPRIRLQASPFAFSALYASTASAATPVFSADIIGAQPQTTYGAITISTNLFVQGGISVGTISPGQKLSVAGILEITGDPLVNGVKFADGSIQYKAAANTMWDVNGNDVYSINTGNVAIGEANGVPLARLHVSTAAGSAGDILLLSTGTSGMFKVNGLGQVYGGSYYGNGATLTGIVAKAGDTMTGQLTINGSSLTITSANGIWAPKIRFLPNVAISSTTAAFNGGVYVSTNIYIVGISSAAKYYGDGGGLFNVTTQDSSKVLKSGDTMTGPLTLFNSTLTVTGAAFSVSGSTFSVFGGSVAIGASVYPYMLTVGGGMMATSSITAQAGVFSNSGNFQTLTVSSATFTGYGPGVNNYTIDTASGIKVNAGIISAPYFVGDGSRLLNVFGTDSNRVLRTGDTMTGNLQVLGSSLTVAAFGAQHYALTVASAASVNNYTLAVTTGGSVGVQVSNPAAPLEVNNKIMVSNTAGGDAFLHLNANGGYSSLRWSDYSLTATGNTSQGAMGYLPTLTRDFVFQALGNAPGSGGSEVFRINTSASDVGSGASWRFGIGTSAPAAKFHIATNVLVSTSNFVSPILYISTTAGTVSISTVNSSYALSVNGGIMAVSSITAQGGFFGDASGLVNLPAGGLPDLIAVSSIAARDTSTYGAVVFTSDTYVNAKLAVGQVFTPTSDLHVRGTVRFDQKNSGDPVSLMIFPSIGGNASVNWDDGSWAGKKGSLGMLSNESDLVYWAGSSSLGGGAEAFRVKSDGKLLVGGAGAAFAAKARFQVVSDLLVSTSSVNPILFVSTASGYVGISTGAPKEGIHIASSLLVGPSRASAALYVSTAAGASFTGIGTGNPRTLLEVGDGNVLASGTYDSFPTAPPVTGGGSRFMWMPANAAIRAGAVLGTEWDTIGKYSVAFGDRNQATTQAATVSGGLNNAVFAQYATIAGGLNNEVDGAGSAIGGGESNYIYAGKDSFVAGGRYNVIYGTYAFAGGLNNYLDTGAQGTFVWGYDDVNAFGGGSHPKVANPYLFLVDPFNIKGYSVGVRIDAPSAALDVNGDAQFGAGVNKSTFTANGYWMPVALTTAQLQSTAPDSAGEVVMNSSITDLCVSTGAAAGQWALVGSRGAGNCY
jgi:hypothetical protein